MSLFAPTLRGYQLSSYMLNWAQKTAEGNIGKPFLKNMGRSEICQKNKNKT
jgi:hypothetical protein